MASASIIAVINGTLPPIVTSSLVQVVNDQNGMTLNLSEKLKLISIILIMITTAVANGFVIIIILSSKKLRSKHKFLLSECTANFLFAVLIMPLSPIQGLLGWWPFGHIYCNINFSLSIALVFTSILNILALTIERYISICHPFKRHVLLKSSHIFIILLYVWIQPLALSLVIFAWRNISYQYQPHQCRPESPHKYQVYEKPYFTVLIMIDFFIPVALVAAMYGSIIRIAWRQNQHIRTQKYQLTGSIRRTNINIKTTDLRATFISIIILGLFCMCWMPFFVITLIVTYDKFYQPGPFQFIIIVLAYINFAVNPIIYASLTSDIRTAIIDFFRRQESFTSTFAGKSITKTTNV